MKENHSHAVFINLPNSIFHMLSEIVAHIIKRKQKTCILGEHKSRLTVWLINYNVWKTLKIISKKLVEISSQGFVKLSLFLYESGLLHAKEFSGIGKLKVDCF